MSPPNPGSASYAGAMNRRRSLIRLAGLLALLLVVNGVVGLFALDYSSTSHQQDIAVLQGVMTALETARAAQVHFKKQVQEWKNILLRGDSPEDLRQYRTAFEAEEAMVQRELEALDAAARSISMDLPLVSQVRRSHAELGPRYRAALARFQPGSAESARAVDALVRGIDREPTDDMDAIVEQFHERAGTLATRIALDARSRYESLRRVSLGATIAGLVIVFAFLGVSFMGPRAD
jgi:hypothetical protein